MDWETWLKQFYRIENEHGKMYRNRTDFSLAISDGRNQNAVSEIENRGITTIERLLALSQATQVNPMRILLEMELISEEQLRAMGLPGVPTEEQEAALEVVDALLPVLRRQWLLIGRGLVESQRDLGRQ